MSSEFGHACYRINILGSQLSPSSINLVPEQAGKVTVGLASHWPCVTDNSGITTYGLTALGREMSTPPKLQDEYGTLYLYLYRDYSLRLFSAFLLCFGHETRASLDADLACCYWQNIAKLPAMRFPPSISVCNCALTTRFARTRL